MLGPYRNRSDKQSLFSNNSDNTSRRSDVDRVESFKLIDITFSPFRFEYSDTEDFDLAINSRDYGSRQEYLRSYKFSRVEQTAPEKKTKKSLLRLKAAAWAVVACNYRLPLRARTLKEKMIIKTSQYLSSSVQSLRPSCLQMPKCLLATG